MTQNYIYRYFLAKRFWQHLMFYAQVARTEISSLQQKHVVVHHPRYFPITEFLIQYFSSVADAQRSGFFFSKYASLKQGQH